jgi:hypothetical protein
MGIIAGLTGETPGRRDTLILLIAIIIITRDVTANR